MIVEDSFRVSGKLPEVDGYDFGMAAQKCGDRLEKRSMFDGSGLLEAGVNIVQT